MNSCNNMGIPVMKQAPRSKFAAAVNSIVAEIHKVLATAPTPLRAIRAAKVEAESTATMIESLRATPDHTAEGSLA